MATDESFHALRREHRPVRPRVPFAVELRRRLEEELNVSLTDFEVVTTSTVPAMVHFHVDDADRAMRFFNEALDWEGERHEWQGSISHYIRNLDGTMPVLTNSREADGPRVDFRVSDLRGALERLEANGGRVVENFLQDDGYGYALVEDPDGNPMSLWRPEHDYPLPPLTKRASAWPERFEIAARDAARAQAFYDALGLGGVDIVQSETRGLRVSLGTNDIDARVARIIEHGGTATEVDAHTFECTDDQGNAFRLVQVERAG